MIINKLKKRLETLEENRSLCIVEFLPFDDVQSVGEHELYKLADIRPKQGSIADMIRQNGTFKRIVSGGTVKDLDKILAWNLQGIECGL